METTTTDNAIESARNLLSDYGINLKGMVKDARAGMADVRDNGWQASRRGESLFTVVQRIAGDWWGTRIHEPLVSCFMDDDALERFNAETPADDPERDQWLIEACERIAETIADAINAVVRVDFPDLPGTFGFGWNDGAYDLMYYEDAVIDDDED